VLCGVHACVERDLKRVGRMEASFYVEEGVDV